MMHALIIEDEAMIALLIEDQLRAFGCTTIDFAVTEAKAIAAARSRFPDLITSDVGLAEGCGIAAVAAIRRERHLPVIFITSRAREVREQMRDAIILAKPFAPADLDLALISCRERIQGPTNLQMESSIPAAMAIRTASAVPRTPSFTSSCAR